MSEHNLDAAERCEVGKRHHDPFVLADDMLQGAEAIGSFMGLDPRQVYHQRKRLPTFKIGALICARKSTLLRWIAEQEAKCGGGAAA